MLDRKTAPEFRTPDRIEVIHAKHHVLDSGIPLYTVDAGSQEIIRLEFVFNAGMYHQRAPLIASGTNSLMETGTGSFTADQISEGIDFYGSFLECGVGQDYAGITLFSLNKYLKESLRFLQEVILCPTFPEDEFRIHHANKRQKHNINSQKVNVVARRRFSELLFGERHPYGIDAKDADFERINTGELKDFYARHYRSADCTVIASGNLPPDLLPLLNGFFGKKWGVSDDIQHNFPSVQSTASQKHFIPKEDAVQSAIRVGRVMFNKTHPDFFHFQIMNTILGGYFGSRLMANIREDKGYTYGIGSGLMSLRHSGYFFISTEVGSAVTDAALGEIYRELDLMRKVPVGKDELETVKNYILGQFLRSVDGPFALADKFRAIWEFGLDYDYFDRYVDTVKNVTADDIMAVADKYLKEKDLIECVVGKKE